MKYEKNTGYLQVSLSVVLTSFHYSWLSHLKQCVWLIPVATILTKNLPLGVVSRFHQPRFWKWYMPRQNGRRFADHTFKRMFLNENVRISIKISLKFVPKDPINNIPPLVQMVAWRRSGDKPLSESLMVSLLTHICVTRPLWVKQPRPISKLI